MKQRVVVTGMGVVAPNGIGKEAFWQALNLGLSGVRSIRRFDVSGTEARIAGEITDFDPLSYFDAHELKKVDRSNLYAMAAAMMALKDSGLELEKEDRERIGSAVGNALGGVDYVDKEIDVMRAKGPRWGSPYLAIAFFSCGTNGLLSIRLGLKGVVLTLCNGNTSGTDAIGAAYRTIQSGRADVMFAGATEAPLVPLFLQSMAKDGFLSKQNDRPHAALRPFQSGADGMVLGEGSAMLTLESFEHARARGAHMYSEITGYASGSSAFDVLRPEPSGWGLAHTMRRVLKEANLNYQDVDVVHSQGLSIPQFDAMEARCTADTFDASGHHPLVTAVGSWIGNSLGGLGAFQAAATSLMLERERIPAVANVLLDASVASLEMVRGESLSRRTDVIVQNSYCFMGKSSTLAFQRINK